MLPKGAAAIPLEFSHDLPMTPARAAGRQIMRQTKALGIYSVFAAPAAESVSEALDGTIRRRKSAAE